MYQKIEEYRLRTLEAERLAVSEIQMTYISPSIYSSNHLSIYPSIHPFICLSLHFQNEAQQKAQLLEDDNEELRRQLATSQVIIIIAYSVYLSISLSVYLSIACGQNKES